MTQRGGERRHRAHRPPGRRRRRARRAHRRGGRAQDYQFIRLGNGFFLRPRTPSVSWRAPTRARLVACRRRHAASVTRSWSDPTASARAPLGGDDQRPPNGVLLNQGLPNAPIIRAGTPGSTTDTICHDTIVPAGDDVVLVAPGNSKPLQLGIMRRAPTPRSSRRRAATTCSPPSSARAPTELPERAQPRRRVSCQQRPLRGLHRRLDLVHHPGARRRCCRPRQPLRRPDAGDPHRRQRHLARAPRRVTTAR